MNDEILKLLDELSFLSRETNGASFTIRHYDKTGLWAVEMTYGVDKLKPTTFDQAIKDGICWIKMQRELADVRQQKYTLKKEARYPEPK